MNISVRETQGDEEASEGASAGGKSRVRESGGEGEKERKDAARVCKG